MRTWTAVAVAIATTIPIAVGSLLTPTAALATPPGALEGRQVVFSEPLSSQLAVIGRPRPLGDELRIGDVAFAVKRLGATTSIATIAGGSPATSVKTGKAVTLTWRVGDAPRKLRVAFCSLPAGTLGWFAPVGWRYDVAGVAITLVDGDADGVYGVPERDGVTIGDSAMVLPLGGPIVLGRSRVTLSEIAPDGTAICPTIEPIVGTSQQFAALSALNRLRVAHGLLPVDLDAEKSAACTLHARYLEANRWTGYSNPHDEAAGAKGFSDSGLAAAQRSVIAKSSATEAIESYWRTWYHRSPLVRPDLRSVGVAAEPAGISVIDAWSGDDAGANRDVRFRDPTCTPADGSTGVPTRFWPFGERPDEPVSGAARRGMPLMLLFASPEHGATDFVAKLVELRRGKEIDVPTLVAAPGISPEAMGVVPEAPLLPESDYRVTFTFTRDGKRESHVARFRTE